MPTRYRRGYLARAQAAADGPPTIAPRHVNLANRYVCCDCADSTCVIGAKHALCVRCRRWWWGWKKSDFLARILREGIAPPALHSDPIHSIWPDSVHAGGYSTLFFADDTPENIDSAQRLLDGRVRTILVDVGCAISFSSPVNAAGGGVTGACRASRKGRGMMDNAGYLAVLGEPARVAAELAAAAMENKGSSRTVEAQPKAEEEEGLARDIARFRGLADFEARKQRARAEPRWVRAPLARICSRVWFSDA